MAFGEPHDVSFGSYPTTFGFGISPPPKKVISVSKGEHSPLEIWKSGPICLHKSP